MFVKIKFASSQEEAKGVMALLREGQVRLYTVVS